MDWRYNAACVGEPGDTFFPVGSALGPAVEQITRAKAICSHCPVRVDCLEWSINNWQLAQWGIWGGQTEDERRLARNNQLRLRRSARRVDSRWKSCADCGQDKSAMEFTLDRAQPDGLNSACRDCRSLARAAAKIERCAS